MATSEKPPEPAPAESDADLIAGLRESPLGRFAAYFPPRAYPEPTWVFTRFFFLRLLGLLYFVAFFSLYNQLLPLLGSRGILPIERFLRAVEAHFGSTGAAFAKLPSLFWLGSSDGLLSGAALVGSILSLLVLAGATNAVLQFVLWAMYLSFVQVGQIFYGYGWEMLLLEAGFLAIFLCPVRSVGPFPAKSPPPVAVIWLFRWLAFRVMFGAGLIKIRGDECWRDLTCLLYHYETQPNPNPLSPFIHHLPAWFHKGGVLFNHLVELVVPFFIFAPRRARHVAGALLVGFQAFLIASGNLSFLNWLTIAVCIFCFDDALLGRLAPAGLRARVLSPESVEAPPSRARRGVLYALVIGVGILSVGPVLNMLSPGQAMNASFEPLHLVNTYGAFGSVGKERFEVILEATESRELNEETEWRELELPCKPGDVTRAPCLISPYHYRLDWQMWFAAMSRIEDEPWLVHLIYKLLQGDPGVRELFSKDPLNGRKPAFVRAELYRYAFAPPGEGGAWWTRTRAGTYLRPVAADDEELLVYLRAQGLIGAEDR
jgi:hypothetical protein